MTVEIGGFGLSVFLIAVPSFPSGITITQFADDADPLDHPAMQISERAMGLNGDLITWKRPVPIDVSLNVVPGSDGDINLSFLANQNRVGVGRPPISDVINMTINYPDGAGSKTLVNGRIIEAAMFPSVASAGRKKSRLYRFSFESMTP